jgi:processive 1,2-diacylglycerol beta-glucosyltransferase
MDSLPNARINILGWTNQIPHLLQTHDLVICKAGGAILHESLAARCPAIIDYIVPGQEEGNARLLLQNGCGAHCPTNEAVVSVLQQLFSKGAHGWQQMHRHVSALSRPDAAITTARWVAQKLKHTQNRTEPPFGIRPGKG